MFPSLASRGTNGANWCKEMLLNQVKNILASRKARKLRYISPRPPVYVLIRKRILFAAVRPSVHS